MRWLDLNQRPLVYETNDLTGLIYIASIPCGGAGGVMEDQHPPARTACQGLPTLTGVRLSFQVRFED